MVWPDGANNMLWYHAKPIEWFAKITGYAPYGVIYYRWFTFWLAIDGIPQSA